MGERRRGSPYARGTAVGAVLLDPDDRLEQARKHPLAVHPRQCQGDLGLHETKLHPQVVTIPAGLECQVSLATSQDVQGGRQLDLTPFADVAADQVVEEIEDLRRQDVHPEEAEIISRAETG